MNLPRHFFPPALMRPALPQNMPFQSTASGVRFAGGGPDEGYASGSSSDEDEETLRAQLKQLLGNIPHSTAGASRKIQFRYEGSPERARETDEPRLKPLSPEAARFIPPIDQRAGDVPLLNPELLESLAKLAASANQAQDGKDSQQAFLEETAARHLEEQRKIKENMTTAKVQWAQLGLAIAGTATFATMALPAVVAAPVASLTTAGIASNMLSLVYKLFNLGTSLATNPQRTPALRSMASGIVSGFRKGVQWLTGGSPQSSHSKVHFSGKKPHPIHFGAGGYAQLQRDAKKEMTSEQLRTNCLQAGETLLQDLGKARSSQEVVDAAQTMQKTVLNSAQELILQHGTSTQKESIRHIRNFTKDHEALTQATPEHAKTYRDLPKPVQNHLRQMIHDTLTGPVAELQVWGRAQGRAIGMSDEQIRQVEAQRASGSSSPVLALPRQRRGDDTA